jgi:hypothetical protein
MRFAYGCANSRKQDKLKMDNGELIIPDLIVIHYQLSIVAADREEI